MSSVNLHNFTNRHTVECLCTLMCMDIVRLCQVFYMEIIPIEYSILFRTRCFVNLLKEILLMEVSAKFNQNFLRKIWLFRKSMINFRNYVLEGFLLVEPINPSKVFFILTLLRYCRIGRNIPKEREITKKKYQLHSMLKYWEKI